MLNCHSSKTFLVISSIVICLIHGITVAEDIALSGDVRALLESSRRAYANDRFDDAVKFAKKATELEPDASVCQLWLGVAYSEKTESGWFGSRLLNARRCRKAFQRAVALDTSSLDAREGLIEFHVRAPGIAGGNMETAWAQVEFIMQHDSVRGHLAAAFIHERKDEDTSAAETALLSAVASDTTSLLAQLRLAGFYLRLRERDKAEPILKAAAESGDREALLNLAWFYRLQGQGQGQFHTILETDPENREALFCLAELHLTHANIALGDSLIATFAGLVGDCPDLNYLACLRTIITVWQPSPATKQTIIDGLSLYLNSDLCVRYDPCWANPHLLAGIYSQRPAWARAHLQLWVWYRRIQGEHQQSKKELELALELDPTFWPAGRMLKMPTFE